MEKISLSHGVLFCKRSNDSQKWQPEGNEETDEKFVGEIKNGLPSGKGTSTYPEWKKYIGKWKEGKRNGQGKETFENGCIVNLTSSRISLKEMRKMRIFQEKSYINIDFLNKSLEEYSLTDNKQKEIDQNTQLFPYDDANNKFILYQKNDK